MRKVLAKFLFAGFALLPLAVSAPAHAAGECTLKQYASIDFTISNTGNLLLPVSFGDKRTYMVLATGSALSTIADSAATQFGMPRSKTYEAEFYMGKLPLKTRAKTDSFKIGELPFKPAAFFDVPDENTISTVPHSDGVIGLDFLLGLDFELDFVHKKLNLYSHDHCFNKVVYWADTYTSAPFDFDDLGNMLVVMELDGKKFETHVSTEQTTTVIDPGAAKSLFGIEPQGPNPVQFMNLTHDGLSIMNAEVSLAGFKCPRLGEVDGVTKYVGRVYCGNHTPLSIGMNVLQKLHLYFAMKDKIMYFTAADAAKSKPAASAP